jgi:HemK-like putative methylase
VTVASSIPFGDLTIEYDDRVLQPRPWTAAQSRWAAALLVDAPPGPVLELCTGAGQIGLLAVLRSDRDLVMLDLSDAACELARRNADAAGLGGRVEIRQGRMQDVLATDERFAMVIADPPWVPTAAMGRFPEDPPLAIDGGADGLDLVRSCLAVIEGHLLAGGSAVLQVGTTEQRDVVECELAGRAGRRLSLAESRVHDRGVLLHLAADA